MKKLFLAAFFCAIAGIASAQLILGGQFTLGSTTNKSEYDIGDDDKTKTTVVSVLPRLAYDAGDDLWVGAEAGFTLVSETDDFGGPEITDKTNLFSIGPFARKTWKPADKMGIWLEGQVAATFGNSKREDEKTAEYFGFSAGVRPGVIFFIGDNLSFEASFGRLGFSSFRTTDPDNSDNKDTTNQFGFTVNNNLNALALLVGDPFSLSGFVFGVNYRL